MEFRQDKVSEALKAVVETEAFALLNSVEQHACLAGLISVLANDMDMPKDLHMYRVDAMFDVAANKPKTSEVVKAKKDSLPN